MSAPSTDCYANIVGLYSGDCNCYDAAPAGYDISDSGLYLSDLLEPSFIDGLLNCDQGASVWTLMEDVRDLAIRNFIADSNALMLQSNKLRRQPYYGGLGMSTFTRDLSVVNGYYAGARIITPIIRSGYLKIKKIGLLLNTTTPLTLDIYDRNGTNLYTLNLNATANIHTVNDITDITLPLYDDYLDYMEYWFIYTVNGFQPKNNGVYSCVTCERNKPEWGQFIYSPKHKWSNWLNIGGFTSAALPNFMNTTTSGVSSLYGLTFQVELGCLVNEVFCKDQLDYEGNTLAQGMALAIQKLSAVYFIDKILTSPNLNRDIMINREQLGIMKQEWIAGYQEMIHYITDNIDVTATDCFECRDIIEMLHGGIFA